MIKADGYTRFRLHYHKAYKANIIQLGKLRYSRRTFKRARDAVAYGRRLVSRYKALKAAEGIAAETPSGHKYIMGTQHECDDPNCPANYPAIKSA